MHGSERVHVCLTYQCSECIEQIAILFGVVMGVGDRQEPAGAGPINPKGESLWGHPESNHHRQYRRVTHGTRSRRRTCRPDFPDG
jgi:hypothetical protein